MVPVAAGGAGEDDGAELAGAAGLDGAQDLAVPERNGVAEALEVGGRVAPHHVRDGGHGGAPRLLHEALDGGDGVLLAAGGQVEVKRGGLQRPVAEVLLDEAKVDAGLQQVGGVAVAEGVQADALLEADLEHHTAERGLHAAPGHGVRGR